MSARLTQTPPWQPAEVERLRSMAAVGLTMEHAASELGRAHCAVKCKAMREQIRFPRKGGKPGPRGSCFAVRNQEAGSARLLKAMLEALNA